MPLPALAALAIQAAPFAARWFFGSRADDAVETVSEVAQAVLGSTDPAQVEAALLSPEKALEFKVQLELAFRQFELEEIRAYLGDRQDSRKFGLELAKLGSITSFMPMVLSLSAMVMMVWLLHVFLTGQAVINPSIRDVVMMLLGVAVSAYKDSYQYWLGTSRGAVEMRKNLQDRSPG